MLDNVITIDNRNYFRLGSSLPQGVVEGAGLETGERIDMKEAKAWSQGLTMGGHRLPDRRILGVVVDDQHFKPADNPDRPGR